MNNNFKSQGFTLIEMLVSMAIIITATTVVVAILASSFRGITKSTISEEVRQNGNSAISRMSRMIQFAETFQGVSVDGSAWDQNCTSSTGTQYKYIKVRSNAQTKILSCANNDISIDSVSLLDNNKVSVAGNSCIFTCLQENIASPPVIGIGFSLNQKEIPTSEKRTNIFFSTTVRMRNF